MPVPQVDGFEHGRAIIDDRVPRQIVRDQGSCFRLANYVDEPPNYNL